MDDDYVDAALGILAIFAFILIAIVGVIGGIVWLVKAIVWVFI